MTSNKSVTVHCSLQQGADLKVSSQVLLEHVYLGNVTVSAGTGGCEREQRRSPVWRRRLGAGAQPVHQGMSECSISC